MSDEHFNEQKQLSDDVKSIITKYSIILAIAIAIIVMLLSTRGRVETFEPESVLGTIEHTASLFVEAKLLPESARILELKIESFAFSNSDWGEYTYEATIEYSLDSGDDHNLFTSWEYSVRDDSLDLVTYSLDGGKVTEP